MPRKIKISDFSFIPAGLDGFRVTYTSPCTGRQWTAFTDNTDLVLATAYTPHPLKKDLEKLKQIAKS